MERQQQIYVSLANACSMDCCFTTVFLLELGGVRSLWGCGVCFVGKMKCTVLRCFHRVDVQPENVKDFRGHLVHTAIFLPSSSLSLKYSQMSDFFSGGATSLEGFLVPEDSNISMSSESDIFNLFAFLWICFQFVLSSSKKDLSSQFTSVM